MLWIKIIPEAISSWLEHAERFDVSLLLGCIYTPWCELYFKIHAPIFGSLLYSCASTQYNQIRYRDIFTSGVEIFLNSLQRSQYRCKLFRVIHLPVFLRGK